VQETDVTTYSFSIYSTVLGRVLRETRTNDDPNSPYAYFNSQTFVYGDSGIIAWQESNSSLSEWVWWEYRDPGNATYRTFGVANSLGVEQELDPYGTNLGTSDGTYQQGIPDSGMLAPYPATNNPSQPNTTYSIDGVRVSLDDFIQNLQVFYKGDLGLNEAIAKESANDRNYQRRWMPGREEGEPGHWQTSAVSITPSLSWFIGSDPQNPVYTQEQIKTAVGNCTKALFNVSMVDFQASARGRNGSFDGRNLNVSNPGNQQIYIVNAVDAYTANQLARIHERIEGLRPGSVGRLAGLTIDFTDKNGNTTGYSPYRNFTAKDVRSGSSTLAGVSAVTDTQIWELGNSLGDITGKAIARKIKEEGPVFEDCVRKQLQGNR